VAIGVRDQLVVDGVELPADTPAPAPPRKIFTIWTTSWRAFVTAACADWSSDFAVDKSAWFESHSAAV
jgi:hypothetical protein